MLAVLAGAVVLGVALLGPIMSNVEQAQYSVVESYSHIEIRDYAPMVVAQAQVAGNRAEAIRQGFKIIADYIFGNNTSAQKVVMTAPVTQQASEKIAMTAPVLQAGNEKSWVVRFVMPANYTLQTLPKPNNTAVELMQMPKRRYAVIRFSGTASEQRLKNNTDELKGFISEKKLNSISEPSYAFFNPPWTLPFLRSNEVMIEIE
jgi:hypothetical protein